MKKLVAVALVVLTLCGLPAWAVAPVPNNVNSNTVNSGSKYFYVGPPVNLVNYPNTFASFIGTSGSNNYGQVIIQDLNPNGQGCIILEGDNATNDAHFGQLCLNGSGSAINRGTTNIFFPNPNTLSIGNTDGETNIYTGVVTGTTNAAINFYVGQNTTPDFTLSPTGASSPHPLPVANGGTGGDGSVNDKTDNYQLLASDCGKVVRYDKAFAVVATIPLNATTSIGNFCSIVIEQLGAGSLSIQCSDSATCASTVAVNKTSSTLTLTGKYGTVLLYKTATNTWLAKGDLQ